MEEDRNLHPNRGHDPDHVLSLLPEDVNKEQEEEGAAEGDRGRPEEQPQVNLYRAEVRQGVNLFKAEVRQGVNLCRAEVKEVSQCKAEVRQGVNLFKVEVRQGVSLFKVEVKEVNREARPEVKQEGKDKSEISSQGQDLSHGKVRQGQSHKKEVKCQSGQCQLDPNSRA